MKRIPPPPVLDNSRVMAYAFVEDIPYRRWEALYMDGILLEHVPFLAICINLRVDRSTFLFHCDSEWKVLGAGITSTVEEGKARAEENYPGVASRWIDMNTSVKTALEWKSRSRRRL